MNFHFRSPWDEIHIAFRECFTNVIFAFHSIGRLRIVLRAGRFGWAFLSPALFLCAATQIRGDSQFFWPKTADLVCACQCFDCEMAVSYIPVFIRLQTCHAGSALQAVRAHAFGDFCASIIVVLPRG